MKKIILGSLVFLLIGFSGIGQPTLTFRVHNPSIYNDGYFDYLQFFVQVKASVAGTYLYSGQANFTYNLTEFGNQTNGNVYATQVGISSGTNHTHGAMYNVQASLQSSVLNVYVNTTKINYPTGGATLSWWFNPITTTYQDFVEVDVQLLDNTQTAQMLMAQSTMNGMQAYQNPVSPYGYIYYSSPNTYDEVQNMQNLYLQRIYSVDNSNVGAWSELGGIVNWSNAQNTSVWDTTTSTAAHITSLNSHANALRIHTGADLNINAGASLTCSGATEINGPKGLIISAGSSGMGQFIDNGTITYNNGATAQVQCYYVYNQWHYYAIPVTTTTAWPYYYKYMKYFQEPTSHWKYVMAPDTILNSSMLGYAMWATNSGQYATSNYVYPTGVLNTGAKSINITFTSGAPNQGWNLVGNPYPSAIDLTSGGVTWGSTFTTLYFWNGASGTYQTYLRGGGGTHDQYVPPQQGFYIYSNVASTTFGLNNTTRLINSDPFLKDVIADRLLLTATSSNNSYYDQSVIRFTDGATNYFDPVFDAFKLYGNFDAPQLYSIGNADTILSVNALPWTGNSAVVPMGFSCGVNGNYSVLASDMQTFPSSITIYLKDLKTNTLQNLLDNPLYNFSYTTTDDPNRFQIQFSAPSSVVDNNSIANMQIYSYENFVYVKNLVKGTTRGTIQIYDLLGRKVFQGILKDTELNQFTVDVNEGYYMVNVITDDNSYNQKVYLK